MTAPSIGAADARGLLLGIEELHARMRASVRAAMQGESPRLRQGDEDATGDTAYGIDRVSESRLLELIERCLAAYLPLVVVAEGLPDVGHGPGVAVAPKTAAAEQARFRLIVDPIDGTRGLMYGKRSGWILTGVAQERGPGSPAPTLRDLEVAVQTEIPPPKQLLADTLRAVRGGGATGTRVDLANGGSWPLPLAPSTASSIDHGFGQVVRAFPGGRDVLAAIDDEVCLAVLGVGAAGRARTFEDQYISTGGQLAELVYGHDRWTADLRPLLAPLLRERGLPPLLCCHPYDICTALIAQEAGVHVLGIDGADIDAPLVVDADVTWVGYANAQIRAAVHPALQAAVTRHGLLSD
jgi:hypothetical protein